MLTAPGRDDLRGVIAVVVLLVGTATGNAYAILGLSVAALVVLPVFCGGRMGNGALLSHWSPLSPQQRLASSSPRDDCRTAR